MHFNETPGKRRGGGGAVGGRSGGLVFNHSLKLTGNRPRFRSISSISQTTKERSDMPLQKKKILFFKR